MALLISCRDCLDNYITLEENWYRIHIRDRHSEATLDDVQNVIENADRIYRDPIDPLVNLYYKKGEYGKAPYTYRGVLKVCVRFYTDSGTVISAYSVRGFKQGEIKIWPTP